MGEKGKRPQTGNRQKNRSFDMQTTLLASAGTIDGILAQVNAFYF